MSRGWQRSNLRIGEEVRISNQLFIGGELASKRIESIKYLGETSSGILLECRFTPISVGSLNEPVYRLMINWASIWSGQTKIYSGDGSLIVAKRMNGQPVAYEVSKK